MEAKKDDALFPSGHYGGKVLIKDNGQNRCGKGGVGKIVHRPAKNLSFLNRHESLQDKLGECGEEEETTLIRTESVIPAKAGIQEKIGFRVKPGMTGKTGFISL